MKLGQGVFPVAFIDQFVPIGDQVAKGTAHVTKRYGAVHASRALIPGLIFCPVLIKFFEIVGKNPLFIYLLSELLLIIMFTIHMDDGVSLFSWIYQHVFVHVGAYFGSFLYSNYLYDVLLERRIVDG